MRAALTRCAAYRLGTAGHAPRILERNRRAASRVGVPRVIDGDLALGGPLHSRRVPWIGGAAAAPTVEDALGVGDGESERDEDGNAHSGAYFFFRLGQADGARRCASEVTSILNGAFLELLGAEMPVIQPRIHRVLYWRSADQPLDFTSKDDVAAYTAAAALDSATPRLLRIAGDTVSALGIARTLSDLTGERYRTLRVGGMRSLGWMIRLTKLVAPQLRETFPPWQGMQYTRDMFSGETRLAPLDNDRYPEVGWTSVREHLHRRPWASRTRATDVIELR